MRARRNMLGGVLRKGHGKTGGLTEKRDHF